MITLKKAYNIAKKRNKAVGYVRGQTHLQTLRETEEFWLFDFFVFFPGKGNEEFTDDMYVKIHDIIGRIPVFYTGMVDCFRVNKNTGECSRIIFTAGEIVDGTMDIFLSEYKKVNIEELKR